MNKYKQILENVINEEETLNEGLTPYAIMATIGVVIASKLGVPGIDVATSDAAMFIGAWLGLKVAKDVTFAFTAKKIKDKIEKKPGLIKTIKMVLKSKKIEKTINEIKNLPNYDEVMDTVARTKEIKEKHMIIVKFLEENATKEIKNHLTGYANEIRHTLGRYAYQQKHK